MNGRNRVAPWALRVALSWLFCCIRVVGGLLLLVFFCRVSDFAAETIKVLHWGILCV